MLAALLPLARFEGTLRDGVPDGPGSALLLGGAAYEVGGGVAVFVCGYGGV